MKKSLVKLVTFESYGKGWQWVERCRVLRYDGTSAIRLIPWRTNEEGEGLWQSDSWGNEKQIEGTCQYRLPHDRKKARAKVMRELTAPLYI